MTSYYFATLHQKKTIGPTPSKNIKIPKGPKEAALEARDKVCKALAFLYSHPKSLPDDHLVTEARELSDIYLQWVVRLQHDGFNNDQYFWWSESLAPKVNHAFNDLNYDAANIIFNRAVVLMNHSDHILTYNVSAHNLEQKEKEAYASLGTAAGDFRLARDLVAMVSTEAHDGGKNELLPDITPEFMELMENLCLAQAQEIGASKAARKDDGHVNDERKKKHCLAAKLVHQCFIHYKDAREVANKKVVCPTEKFGKMCKFIDVKCAIYESLTCAYWASWLFDDKPDQALWLLKRCSELMAPVRTIVERAKFDHFVASFLDGAEQTIRHIQERIESMNRLVVRARPCENPVEYPPAQVLARAKEVTMPEPAALATDGNAAVDEVHKDWDVVDKDNK